MTHTHTTNKLSLIVSGLYAWQEYHNHKVGRNDEKKRKASERAFIAVRQNRIALDSTNVAVAVGGAMLQDASVSTVAIASRGTSTAASDATISA